MAQLGGTPILIMREGTERQRGRDAMSNNIAAAIVIAEAIRTSLGPRGMDKMLVDQFGDVVITNDGATILKEIDVQHPAAKMMVEVAKTQDSEVGDGTTTSVILAGELLKRAKKLLEQKIHPTVITEGFRKAADKAIEILEKMSVKSGIDDEEGLKNSAMTCMSSKIVSESKEKLAIICMDAIKAVAEKDDDGNWVADIDKVQIQKKAGESIDDTNLIKGIILDKEVVSPGMPKIISDAKILLLQSAIEIEKTEFDTKLQITRPEQIQEFLDEEEKMIRRMVEKIVNSGANVVICQKGIDDLAQHFLSKKGIMAIRRASAERIIDAGMTPIFQYAVFYTQDLEMLPGPNFTLSGRVHSNRDMYLGSNNTLTVNSEYLRAVGSMYLRRKNDGSLMGGNVRAKIKGSADYYNFEQRSDLSSAGIPSVSGFDSDFHGYDGNDDGDFNDDGDLEPWAQRSQTLWGGTVMTGEHGLQEVVPPSVHRFMAIDDEGEDGFFYSNADLVIRDNRAFLGDIDVTAQLPSGTISEKVMYDGRENKNVTVTEIDMEKLGESGYYPANGLLYAYRTDSSASSPNGIRLKNGAELAGPLTVVSEDPVYVWGDYNNVNKKPASIMTDAINILSNGWDNSKTAGHLPSASTTTINAAFITGNQVTEGGAYNGGLENLPRFHENWSGKTCYLRGSFVNIFESDVGTGSWSYGGDNYTAPNRNWDYDLDFNDFDKLPPFTPYVVTIVRVVQTIK